MRVGVCSNGVNLYYGGKNLCGKEVISWANQKPTSWAYPSSGEMLADPKTLRLPRPRPLRVAFGLVLGG